MSFRKNSLRLLGLIIPTIVGLSFYLPDLARAAEPAATYNVARHLLGKEMWKDYGLPNGKLGCAAALSNILKKAGIQKASSPLVTGLRRQLLAKNIFTADMLRL